MNILLLITELDIPYLSRLKPLIPGTHTVKVKNINCSREVDFTSAIAGFDAVISCREDVLYHLLDTGRKMAALNDYAGSIMQYADKEILILNPLSHLVQVNEGPHLFARYLTKLFSPELWFKRTEFRWGMLDFENWERVITRFSSATLIGVDIETGDVIENEVPVINCITFCAYFSETHTTESVVLPIFLNDVPMFAVEIARKFADLEPPKVFQNGMYDNAYLICYNIICRNWYYDTLHLFHSWYSELPKRLDFITIYTLRDVSFWKDEGKTGNLEDYYRYNARDGWATVNALLSILASAPKWAIDNYVNHEFRLVYPSLQCSLDGLVIDPARQKQLVLEQENILRPALERIQKILGVPGFNPNSSPQVLQLFKLLGESGETSSDKKAMERVADKHPINALIIKLLGDYRKARKLLSTYINLQQFNGRWMYALQPAGTDTGRFASKSSHFWCGTQLQNVPPYAKRMVKADTGFLFCGIDNEQSESRCTAYESEDLLLIETVENSPDFHCTNASLFFGIPFEELYDIKTGKKLNKPLRDLSKRTNHGANYNMGPNMLLETMGEKNVVQARRLLKLPASWGLKKVCEHLLDVCFHKTYQGIRPWYMKLTTAVRANPALTSSVGWTRYFFGKPWESKPALNALVAHVPQSLSVMIVNEGFWNIWYQLQDMNTFRLKAQIHDENFFAYKIGREDLVEKAQNLMKLPKIINGRTMLIPTAATKDAQYWADLKE